MQIEEGCFYLTRAGAVVGPMIMLADTEAEFPARAKLLVDPMGRGIWSGEGHEATKMHLGKNRENDLVQEVCIVPPGEPVPFDDDVGYVLEAMDQWECGNYDPDNNLVTFQMAPFIEFVKRFGLVGKHPERVFWAVQAWARRVDEPVVAQISVKGKHECFIRSSQEPRWVKEIDPGAHITYLPVPNVAMHIDPAVLAAEIKKAETRPLLPGDDARHHGAKAVSMGAQVIPAMPEHDTARRDIELSILESLALIGFHLASPHLNRRRAASEHIQGTLDLAEKLGLDPRAVLSDDELENLVKAAVDRQSTEDRGDKWSGKKRKVKKSEDDRWGEDEEG